MSAPLLAFIGPSGTGKSAIVRSLAGRGVICVHPTWTTRPRRRDEADGPVEHRFVSEDEFLCRRDEGFFLHAVQMFGMRYWYGLPSIQWNGSAVTDAVMLRAPLVPILRAAYPDPVIYQIDAAVELVEARLAVRDYTTDELRARLTDNERELVAGRRLAHRTFRNDRLLDAVVDDVERAIRKDFTFTLLEAR
jgi:guanylate kinase